MKKLNGNYALLIEGARRVEKSTLAEAFGHNEYKSYILIDLSNPSFPLSIFNELNDIDLFFCIFKQKLESNYIIAIL